MVKLGFKKFDLIIHYYVLEHIKDPVSFIKEYMNYLSDGGKMIFEVPCATDPLVELYHSLAFDKFYWSVAHHWYFNKESLTDVLNKTGYKFQLFPDQRYDLSNHITWMLEGKPGGMNKYSHIFGTELDKLYKEKLKENWLCDTIICVIEK
jgi:SAM-dependent methyltransferase